MSNPPDATATGPRPSVAVVGAGRVGGALARLLAGRGYAITDVVSRTAAGARAGAAFVGGGRPASLRSLRRIAADVILVSVPDDAIAAVADRLASLGPPAGAVALHTSGARDAAELAPLRAAGAAVGSMHPLQSFPTPELALRLVEGSVFALEGDPAAIEVGVRIARDLGGRPVLLRPGAKALYHGAAVLASGGVTALLDMSLGALVRAGLSREEALRALMPLVQGTVSNVSRVDTAGALTGPFERGDEGTIARNRAALADLDARVAAVYDLLGERGRELSREAGVGRRKRSADT